MAEAGTGLRQVGRDPWPWVGLACALAFLALAAVVTGGGSLPFDDSLTAAVQGLEIPVWFWELCSFLGGWQVRVAIGIVLVLGAVLSGRPRLAVILAIVLIAAPVFVELTKGIVARPRPPDPLVPTSGYSFPSGHTLDSTVTYGVLALVVWRSPLPTGIRWAAVAAGVTVPFLTGLSRIALGAHYPSDVFGGWLAGLAFVAVAAVLIRTTRAMERALPRPAETVPPVDP